MLWMAVQTVSAGFIRHPPFSATSFTGYCRTGWGFYERYEPHRRYGDAWVLVTPAWTWLIIADSDAIMDIFQRGKEFKRPVFMQDTTTTTT